LTAELDGGEELSLNIRVAHALKGRFAGLNATILEFPTLGLHDAYSIVVHMVNATAHPTP